MDKKIMINPRRKTVLKSFVLLLLVLFSVNISAQITVDVKNQSLKEIFKVIESKTAFRFFYNEGLKGLDKISSLQVNNVSIEQMMSSLLKNTDIDYKLEKNNLVVLIAKTKNEQGTIKKVTGLITDVAGEPIIGAIVKTNGSKTSTVTDVNGKFSLDATEQTVLTISFIGYLTTEFKVGEKTNVVIVLNDEPKKLDEVVVIGYGVQKKSSLTASVASISSKEINKQMASNVASTLQGRTAGVDIIQQSGIAGADVNVVIRGAASFGATEPLYVIDGAFANNGLSSLNPSDIESIEILKDGAAAAIYGSRAANGVILITTKKGQKGTPTVELEGSYGLQKPTKMLDFLDASEWRTFANTVADNSGLAHAPENDTPTNPGINTNWEKLWLQDAPIYNLTSSISGGGENSSYRTSVGYLDQKGMTVYSGYKRYNFSINSNFKKGIMTLSQNLSITNKHKLPTAAFNLSLPTLPVYDSQGRFTSGGPDYYINPEDGKQQNKLAPLHYTDQYSDVTDVIGGMNLLFDLYKGLKYKIATSGNYSVSHGYTHAPQYYTKYNTDGTPNKDYGNPTNSISESMGYELNYTIDNLLTYNRTIGNHSFDALLGTSWMMDYNRGNSIRSIADLGATNITGVSNVDGKISASDANFALLSYFGRLNYDYLDKYLLSLSVRRDESSKFHKDNRVGYFPSVSAGWNAHAEPWFENPILSKFKIRASYGELGANFLAPYNFDPIAFGPIPYTLGGIRYVDGRAAYLKSRNLKWETSKSTDVALELGFLNNDLTLSVDYFNKKNIDLLAQIDLNLSSGQVFEINTSREKPYVNSASVLNRGWEFLTNYHKQITNDFNIDVTGNVSTLQNKVLALGANVQPITSGAYSSFFNDAPSITKPGYSIGSFYGYKIEGFDANGNFMFKDLDENGIVNANDKTILGSPIPDFSYGLNITMQYKQFDLTLFGQGVSGNKIFNAEKYTYFFDYSNNCLSGVMDAWSPTNQKTNIPIMKTQNTNGGNSLPSEFYIEDGSYFRIKNLQIGYNLPTSLLKRISFNRARIYCGVQNLLTLSAYSGMDPEVSSNALFSRGIDTNSYPNSRTITIGFNVSF